MNPFLEPLTPPRSAKTRSHVQFVGNENAHDSLVPQTPNKKEKTHLQTPSTLSNGKRVRNFLQTPSSVRKANNSFLASPETTPYKSPRKTHRRRKSHVSEDTALLQTPARDVTFGLFLPTPSTVGSGRKTNGSRPHLKAPQVSLDSLAALNDNLQFEDETDGISKPFSAVSSSKTESFLFSSNLRAQPKMAYEPESPSKTYLRAPRTPRKQIIDEHMVEQWNADTGNDVVLASAEEVDMLRRQQKPLANPFIDAGEHHTKHIPQSDVDFSTHAEYINSRTGERKVVELLERQQQIRPKKLDFTGI